MFLLVPAYPGCPGSKAVKRSLLLLLYDLMLHNLKIVPHILTQKLWEKGTYSNSQCFTFDFSVQISHMLYFILS